MRGRSLESSSSSRIGGEQLMVPVAEHCGAWCRVWSSSLSCGTSRRRGSGCRAYCAPRLIRRGADGDTDSGLVPVNGHTTFEGHCPCPPRVLQRKEYKDW